MNEDRQSPNRTLAILGVGTLGFVLAQTTVIPALGEMQKELGASASGIAWMVTAYLLVASIATPIFGKLGDMFGKERLLAVSLAAFAVGSVVCALSDSLGLMIVGRGLQGLGGGVFPLSFGIIRDEFPANKVPTGIALLGAISAIGSGVGLPLGGVLTDGPGYHWIFWVAAIMGVLATITTIKFVPESPIRTPGRVDFVGAGILAVGLTALLVAISRGASWGWGSPETIGLIAAGLIVLILFGVFEARHKAPLVNMKTLARRPVLTTNISTLLIGSAMIATFVLVPQLAQLPDGGEGAGFGLSATQAGLLLAPGSLLSLLIAPFVGKAGERFGSKPPFLVGCLIVGGALLGMAFAHGSPAIVIVWCALLFAGVGMAFASIPNLIVNAVDSKETGEATGVNTIIRNIGSAIGAQVAGVIIASHVIATGVADSGFTLAFVLSAVGALVAAASVLLIPGRTRAAALPSAA
ncbi:MFS transporter [Solirubrobacter taibaiensis]|nr:MFS transporter [Solirubrobacter taibaiensis]